MGTLIVEKKVTMSELSKMVKPVAATKFHKPIPHFQAITSVINNIESRGLEVSDLEVGTSHQDMRCFWLAKLKGEGDYAPMIGGRNSHDRSISFSLYGGASIFICSNLMVSAPFADTKKHMGEIKTELPEMVNTSIDRVLRDNSINKNRIKFYKEQTITDKDAYWFAVNAMKMDILAPSKIKYIVEQWHSPLHDEFAPKTAWSLHNCFTEVFKDLHSADLVYHRNNVLTNLVDDFTDFKKPIIDITPAKKEEKVIVVNTPKVKAVSKPKAKTVAKKKTLVITNKDIIIVPKAVSVIKPPTDKLGKGLDAAIKGHTARTTKKKAA